MTNQEALEIIKGYKQRLDESCSNQLDKDKEAFALAIKALENETLQGDLISREVLLKAMEEERQYLLARGQTGAEHILVHYCLPLIDNAPTVEAYPFEQVQELVKLNQQFAQEIENLKRPQGKREFIEILAQYVPDDICTYPEYKGKPYYSIHYKENGEEFVGFGTYNPEVLSRYLKEYFMKGDAE